MATSILEAKPGSSQTSGLTNPDAFIDASTQPFPVRKFSVSEYELIARFGILENGENVELLEGWLVNKMTKYPAHVFATQMLIQLMNESLPAGFHLRSQDPIITSDSVPEPDVAIVPGTLHDYLRAHPTGTDAILVVEVADSSLIRDRRKANLYARGGVATYWIVNVSESCVEVYSEPVRSEPAHYQNHTILTCDMSATIQFSESLTVSIPIKELFPTE